MRKAPLDIIADNLPTYADCYVSPKKVNLPSLGRLTKDAQRIITALAAEGYQVLRMDLEEAPHPSTAGQSPP